MTFDLSEEDRKHLTELLFVVLANEEILPQWIDSDKVADLLVKVNGDEAVTKDMVMFIVRRKVREEKLKAMKELRRKYTPIRRR